MGFIFHHHVVLFMFSDLPRVLNMPVRIFLPRNMEGHIKCSVEANPPFTLIVWTKNERIIDFTHTSRLKLNKDGTLVINDVDDNDEGRYTCTPYSPLGAGRSSSVVQIHVRGQYTFYCSIHRVFYAWEFLCCVLQNSILGFAEKMPNFWESLNNNERYSYMSNAASNMTGF